MFDPANPEAVRVKNWAAGILEHAARRVKELKNREEAFRLLDNLEEVFILLGDEQRLRPRSERC